MMKFLAVIGFLAVLVGLGFADAMINKEEISASLVGGTTLPPPQPQPSSEKPVAVPVKAGPDVEAIIADRGLASLVSATEKSLLEQVGQTTAKVETRSLIAGNDRIGSITWVTDGNVKNVFAALKQALLQSFSPNVQGLRDEKEERSGFQARTILTFLDPKLSSERFLFVQSGENLYEFHIVPGREQAFYDLTDALTKR